ncbi:MAG: PEP-CTERM sorting domain-containing protein [Planctomycetes bacterium]|nr:PEP-CTERM sorting domain-containing protein [Planctomycetota bacterium]
MQSAAAKLRVVVALLVSIGILMPAVPARAVLTLTVDLGTPADEAEYTLTNWGPVEPTTHPGGWGGIAGDPASPDRRCRTVWGYVENTKYASITFPTAIVSATIRHLDGGSDDSFIVEVDGNFWGSYSAVPGAGEFWTTSSFSGTPGMTMAITCAGPAGPYWNPYGQLGVDRIEATPIPEPATLLLLGLGSLALLRKRRG